jgi:hypothetical protein
MTTKALAINTSRTGVVGGKGSPIADDKPAKVSTGEAILNAGATKAFKAMLKKTGMTIDEFNEKHAPKGAETKVVNGVLHAAGGDLVDKEKIPVQQPVTQALQTKTLANPLNQPTLNSSATGLTPDASVALASTSRNLANEQVTRLKNTDTLTYPAYQDKSDLSVPKQPDSLTTNTPEAAKQYWAENKPALDAKKQAFDNQASKAASNIISQSLQPVIAGGNALVNGINTGDTIPSILGQAVSNSGNATEKFLTNIPPVRAVSSIADKLGQPVGEFIAGTGGVGTKASDTATPSLAATPAATTKSVVAADGNIAVTGLNPAPKFEQVSPVVTPNDNPMADNQVAMKSEQIRNNDGSYVVKQKMPDGKTSYSDGGISALSTQTARPTPSLAGKPEVVQPMAIGGQPVNNMGVPTGQPSVSTGVDSRYGAGGMNASVANTQSLAGGSTPQERAVIQQRELSQPLPAAPIDQKQAIINNLLQQSQVHDGTFGGASRRNEAMKQLAVLTGIGQDDRKLAMADDESAYKKKRDLVGDTQASQSAIAAAGKSQRDYLLEAMKVQNTLDAPVDFKSINESGEQRTRTMTKAQLAQQTIDYDGYKAAMQKHEGNPEMQKQITDRARINGLI